ncbi:helix-turn-helix domain-containing protein [Ellagibacter isourolithinifaciens]|uniref:helix-turn-helix domain-containing protein n=1 Tax=Ellagibacter isourolithinifaciens TaxID=2137581 RepID=UPI003AF13AC5
MEGDDRARLDEAAKELERERKREWYRRNAALVSDRHRARYASDPEFRAKRKAVADRYRAAHREEILAKRRAYYREHREAILANERVRRRQRRLSQAQRVDASWMAEQLRSYRSHGVSAAEMARRIGCDRQVVDALLHGKRGRVRAETLYKFMLAKPGLDEMRKLG